MAGGAGAHGAAAALWRDASGVAIRVDQRDRALLDAADALLLAGRLADASALQSAIEAMAPSARRSYVQGRLAYVVGPRRQAGRHLRHAWEERDPDDLDLAGRIAAMAAIVSLDRGDGPAAMAWTRRAIELAPERAALASTAHVIAGSCALTGAVEEGRVLLDALCAQATGERAGRDPALADAHYGRGLLRLWEHDLPGAEADLRVSLAAAVRAGSFAARESARCYLAEVLYRQGRWDDAVLHAEVSASIVEDGEQTWLRVLPHAAAARPLAARGRPEGTAHATAALEAAEAVGVGSGIALSRASALEAAACRRDHEQVAALGDLLWDAQGGAVPEGVAPWRAGYVESLVALGRRDDASAVCRHLSADRRTPLVATHAARAAVVEADGRGDVTEAEAAAAEGLALDAAVVGPYPRALLELVVGRSRRHRGERRAARGVLEHALDRFRALGAEPWTQRAEREIAACGLRPARRQARPGRDLTPQESTVAQLVAKGLTNREVAAELVVSVKTVEHHLSHIYGKLGVRSRTELTRTVLGAGG